jgi:hypothetical protein
MQRWRGAHIQDEDTDASHEDKVRHTRILSLRRLAKASAIHTERDLHLIWYLPTLTKGNSTTYKTPLYETSGGAEKVFVMLEVGLRGTEEIPALACGTRVGPRRIMRMLFG